MSKLAAEYHSVPSLDAATRNRMFALFNRYYDAVDAAQFEQDLNGKSIAILLWDAQQELQGFSTIEVCRVDETSPECMLLYSGDTIISHEHWGEQRLAYAWCYFAGQIKKQRPETPLYWFLIVKGHRTYRYLPAFTRRFFPRHREATPAELQNIVDIVALKKFGRAYNPATGVLHFDKPRGHLRQEWSELGEEIVRKPDVQYFLKRNPGYVSGDELVCITELCDDNMRFISRTAFLEGLNSCRDGLIFDVASLASAGS
ncbi:MAG: hypothetical protein OEW68_02540 [Gammaproteobacteria bacterium]|nr:hypothetical protein [Gammaproteobacteria bacterium]MDH4313703.1 hypothetical protein [Gammaproteobacteria bacterium]MDH5212947.1 hypothetical protein [Gammaproteobacteria bacterium]